MTKEEKAKHYDEAIQRAGQFMETPYLENSDDVVGFIFPELKESEDERIRKSLAAFFAKFKPDDMWDDDFSFGDILAWFEKQGEQKPAFEIKTPEESLGIDSDTYNKIVDECVYGEQISANETPYPETLEEAIDLYYNSYGNGEGEFEHLSLEKFRDIVHTFVSDYGQKTAWSEEDERMYKKIETAIDSYYAPFSRDAEEMSEWLKSLKGRYTWKPSDEQIKAIKWIIDGDNPENWSITLENLYQDLKKQIEE